MRVADLSPNSLVASTESIRGSHHLPEQRQPLIAAGFDWTRFERNLADLQTAGIGFARGCYPIRLQLDDAAKRDKVGPLLDALRRDLAQLRELGPSVFTGPDQICSRVECTVPDGTPHAELGGVDPAQVYVIALQDSNEFVREELQHLTRMTNTWALYLFGNYLGDTDFTAINFRRFRELRVLDLAENRLTSVPAGVVNCAKLEWLNLARNSSLRNLPVELGRLRALRLLDLRGTNVSAQAIRLATGALPNCEVRV